MSNTAKLIFLLVFTTLVCQAQSDTDYLLQQGRAALEKNDFEQAFQAFEKAHLASPSDPEPAYWLARLELSRGNAQRAVNLLETVTSKSADHAEYQYWYGTALAANINNLGKLKQLSQARRMRKAWERAIAIDPGHLPARIGLLQYYLQAPGIAGGSRKKALAMAEELTKLDKIAGFRAMVAIHLNDKEYEKAIKVLVQAISSMPGKHELYLELGWVYLQQENWQMARQQFQELLKIEPENMNALYQLGRTALFSGMNMEEGRACLEKYLSLSPSGDMPSSAWAHTRLGQLLAKMGRESEARRHLEKALSLDPKIKEAEKALAEIN